MRERLSSRKGFVWLKREITPQQQKDIYRLGLPGIGFLRENKRDYPNGVDVSHLIEASGEFWEYPLCDREPLPRWSHGRVTLLGDAAHPMYPVGSNGASQAILDARCLADKLVSADNAMHALWQYDQERLPMTTQIVLMNRKGGPEGVIDAIEARAPDGFGNIDDVMSYEDRKAIVRGYASTAGFAKTQVNKAA